MKLLIIRFSSFGDIVQGLGAPAAFKLAYPNAEVHWLVRSDFADLLLGQRSIDKVWSFDRKQGFGGLLGLCAKLRREGYTHVYDAHNNLRSFFVSLLVRAPHFARRSKNRWLRFLLFKLGINRFPRPFIAQRSYLEPLETWTRLAGLPPAPLLEVPHAVSERIAQATLPLRPFVALAPSTAWAMKNWPLSHWRALSEMSPHTNFVVLGGPSDEECIELGRMARPGPGQTLNLAGRLSWIESCAVLAQAEALVSADTGLLHAADQLGRPAVALIGPTAFGYPARVTTKVLEVPLACRPCSKDGRGKCRNDVYQRCMTEISPQAVRDTLLKALSAP
ncbi:MAG TPA: glycosyltransferase family 9 protein [Bdellovibrionales bacterium]|nr:glycosyltransferase family 9 protein [Bdellovibrionales bacterium]